MSGARAATSGRARDSARAQGSPFRRHWTWRRRAGVVVAGWLIALVLRLMYVTLRVRLVDHSGLFARRRESGPVLAAFWHDAIVLLPLLVTRLGWPGTVNVLLSWHRDAEIAAQAMRHLGIHAVRGSGARGWIGGLRGLLAARTRGEDIAIVPDGPRGPRRKAKSGAVQLARGTGLPFVVVGAATRPVHRLASWDRMQLPWLFARVGLVVSAPLVLPGDEREAVAALQTALAGVDAEAAALVGAGAAP